MPCALSKCKCKQWRGRRRRTAFVQKINDVDFVPKAAKEIYKRKEKDSFQRSQVEPTI